MRLLTLPWLWAAGCATGDGQPEGIRGLPAAAPVAWSTSEAPTAAQGRPVASRAGTSSGEGGGSSQPPDHEPLTVCINEWMPGNFGTLHTPAGHRPDWIELYNAGDEAVALDGWALSDDPDEPDKHILDGGLVLDPGTFLLLYADDQAELGPTHLGFSLDSDGEALSLFAPDGRGQVIRYGYVARDFSIARTSECCTTPSCLTHRFRGTAGYGNSEPAPPTVELISLGSTWRVLSTGVTPADDWVDLSFDDSTWLEGPAPIGFGDAHQVTVIDGGPSGARHPTTWMRHSFSLTQADHHHDLDVFLMVDDAARVWLNGEELLRSNLTTDGVITPATWALAAVGAPNETAVLRHRVDASSLQEGENIVAVEVHQAAATSSDLGFDLGLQATRLSNPP